MSSFFSRITSSKLQCLSGITNLTGNKHLDYHFSNNAPPAYGNWIVEVRDAGVKSFELQSTISVTAGGGGGEVQTKVDPALLAVAGIVSRGGSSRLYSGPWIRHYCYLLWSCTCKCQGLSPVRVFLCCRWGHAMVAIINTYFGDRFRFPRAELVLGTKDVGTFYPFRK